MTVGEVAWAVAAGDLARYCHGAGDLRVRDASDFGEGPWEAL